MKSNHRTRTLSGRGPYIREHRGTDGTVALTVTIRELTPCRAKIADRGALVSGLVFFCLLAYGAVMVPTQSWQAWLAVFALPLMSFPLLWLVYRHLIAKRTLVEFTPEDFRVKTLLGWRHFDRRHAHAFALLPHDKAPDERDAHDLAMRKAQLKGKAIRKKRYYGDSFHLSYDYLGQRNDLMTIYGHKRALAVQARLRACDEVMDGVLRRGNGVSLRPVDEWSEQPGEIPVLS